MSEVSVKDAVVFVTGANRGIGRAIAEEAVARGAKRVYAAARNVSGVQDLVDQHPDTVVAVELDVTNSEQIANAAAAAPDVQILINNAGVARFAGAIFNNDEDGAHLEMETNYFGPMRVSGAFAPAILKNGNGAIATVVSVSGFASFPMAATYSASKAAAHSLTQAMRAEMAPQGVGVFGVYPGPIDTDMAAGLEFDKESPGNVAIRIFDQMEAGVEDITTDAFADNFVQALKSDAKAVEKQNAEMAHQPAS
ncbi:MAG: SDR family oxidoreductase [Woeseiaceae bacterium]|nr:SDR family oxidoreductase [Woeseiaceae bacterium]